MKVQTKPLYGAVVLAVFITVCLLWMISGLGKNLPWALYGLVFLVSTVGIYFFAINLTGDRKPEEALGTVDERNDRR